MTVSKLLGGPILRNVIGYAEPDCVIHRIYSGVPQRAEWQAGMSFAPFNCCSPGVTFDSILRIKEGGLTLRR